MQICENYPVMQLVKVISLCTNAAMFLKNRFDQDDTINEHQYIPLPLMDNWRLLGAVLCIISKSVILILIPSIIKNSWKICVNVDTACRWWLLDSPKVSLPGVGLELGLAVGLSDLRSIKPSDYQHRIIVLACERCHNAYLTAKITLFVRFDLFMMSLAN